MIKDFDYKKFGLNPNYNESRSKFHNNINPPIEEEPYPQKTFNNRYGFNKLQTDDVFRTQVHTRDLEHMISAKFNDVSKVLDSKLERMMMYIQSGFTNKAKLDDKPEASTLPKPGCFIPQFNSNNLNEGVRYNYKAILNPQGNLLSKIDGAINMNKQLISHAHDYLHKKQYLADSNCIINPMPLHMQLNQTENQLKLDQLVLMLQDEILAFLVEDSVNFMYYRYFGN